MDSRELRHLFTGKQRHHPDFNIIPRFADIIPTEDQIDCRRARSAIDVLERNAELFLSKCLVHMLWMPTDVKLKEVV